MTDTDILSAWMFLEQGPLYLLKSQGEYLIEEPEPESDCCEGIIRVFLTYTDALYYLDQAQPFFEKIEVVTLSMKELYDQIDDIETQAVAQYSCPAAIVVSDIKSKDDHPRSVDVFWSAFSSTPETWN